MNIKEPVRVLNFNELKKVTVFGVSNMENGKS